MSDITNLVKMTPITSLNVIQAPSGRFIYAGKVPTDLGYIDATPEKIEAAAKFGQRFGPKTRTFETQIAAVEFAAERGFRVENA